MITQVVDGRAPIIRGTLRWTVLLLAGILIAQSLAVCFILIYTYRYAAPLINKPPLVFEVNQQGTFPRGPSETSDASPRDVEIHRAAWDAVRLTVGADSTNVVAFFAEAKKMMTPDMREAFERELEPSQKQIMDLQVYRALETDAESIRQMSPADARTPQEGSLLDRFDVLVSGHMKTFRLSTGEQIMSGRFTYHVKLVPTARTLETPSGLRIASLQPYGAAKKEEANANQ